METGFRVPLRRGDDSRCLGRPRLVPHLRLPPLLRAGCLSAHLAFSRADNVQAINGRVVSSAPPRSSSPRVADPTNRRRHNLERSLTNYRRYTFSLGLSSSEPRRESSRCGHRRRRSKPLGYRRFQLCPTFGHPQRSPWGPNVAVSAPRPPVRRCQRGRQTEEQDVEAAVELRGAVVIGQI